MSSNPSPDADSSWRELAVQAYADREAELAGRFGDQLAKAMMQFDFQDPVFSIGDFAGAVEDTALQAFGHDQAKVLAQVVGAMLELLLNTPRRRVLIQDPPSAD